MSYTEFHTGRLIPVTIEISLEKTCRDIAKIENIELGDSWEEDFTDKFDSYNKKRGGKIEYFIHGDKLYKVVDHFESHDEETFMKLYPNSDGSISFVGSFYNGGTDFTEMLEEALDEN